MDHGGQRTAIPYRIEYSDEALEDLDYLAKRDQVIAADGVKRYLTNDPGVPSRARRPLRPNVLGVPWALHLGALRVYYDVDEEERVVHIARAGRKPSAVLYLRSRPFALG